MNNLREAAQQALEALEDLGMKHCEITGEVLHKEAYAALRAALAQQEPDLRNANPIGLTPPQKALQQAQFRVDALAQQEQAEPVLVVEKEPDYMSRGHFYEGSKPFIDPTLVWKLPIGTKLYTAPPRREWRGLSVDEIDRIAKQEWGEDHEIFWFDDDGIALFARALETALKEKNT